jgi:Fe-S-cluster containining protein
LTVSLENCDICKNCPDDWECCRNNPHVPITAEEIKRGLKRCDEEGDSSFLPLNEKGHCVYFDDRAHLCTCYENRPRACKVAFCKNMPEYKDGTLQERLIQQQIEEGKGCV